MPLNVTQCSTKETWYQLGGELEACELFPKLLSNSNSWKEMEEVIDTKHEIDDGPYDGCPAEKCRMANEIAMFTESAIAEFRGEALAAAKAILTALKAGQTLLRRDFKEIEKTLLEEAAKELAISVPWDAAEAAQLAAEETEKEARSKRWLEEEERRKQQTAEVLNKARALFEAGDSHTAVRALFPNYAGQIGNLVGDLRWQGQNIPRQ